MRRFAPFETAPALAVGVSGGADSLCLVHLADAWARDHGGRAVALTVDHGLRPEAAGEARQVAGWMGDAGIAHHILTAPPPGDGSAGNLQAGARASRLSLLEDWCRDNGVLHLLLAHHRDDQAETVLQRLARGSGVHGLAAMTPEKTFRHVRVLRPLLDQPHCALIATLGARGLAWIEDPSNRDPRFDRARLRRALAAIVDDDDLVSERLAHTAGAMRRTRRVLDRQIDRLLARGVILSPLGYALVDAAALTAGDRDLAARALGLVCATVGATPHPPRRESMLRWLARLAEPAGAGATLAGTMLTRWRDRWLVCREPAAVAAPVTLHPGEAIVWDGRFACELDLAAKAPMQIAAAAYWPEVFDPGGDQDRDPGGDPPGGPLTAVPAPARRTLPAARVLDGTPSVPHLKAGREALSAVYSPLSVVFSPPRPLTDPVGARQISHDDGAISGLRRTSA